MPPNKMVKNGSITSFFKPVSQGSQGSASQSSQSKPSKAKPPNSQISLPPPSSPPFNLHSSSPPRLDTPPPPRTSFGRDAVILGSDDDDDDEGSDSSLPDMETAIPRLGAYPVSKREPNPCVTPKAKRTAMEFHSPLSIRQPRHKFDMKALLSHAETDDATDAAAKRVSALFSKKSVTPEAKQASAAAIQEHMMALATDGDDGELDKEKLKRAIQRTEINAVCERWYFFKEYFSSSSTTRSSFPVRACKGRWSFLKDAKLRSDAVEQGLVHHVMHRNQDLPDEIFDWILDEVCLEPQNALRARYVDIIARCPEQVRRLVDSERVCHLFQNLGSRWESTDLSSKLELVPAVADPYPTRNWSHLRSLLALLSRIAKEMDYSAVSCATKLLLRLGIDTMVDQSIDILWEYQDAIQSLASNVPQADQNEYCNDACESIFNSVEKSSLRWQALRCLPYSTPPLHELRRRLATVFLFDDLARGQCDLEEGLDLRDFIDRLSADEFSVSRDTDYPDLAAMIRFLDVAIDDGRQSSSASDEKEFNADIDELVRRLRSIFRRIDASPSGSSKLDSKTLLEGVEYRLRYSVRTKRPMKQSIFDNDKDDKTLVKQQEYMRKMFVRKAKPVINSEES